MSRPLKVCFPSLASYPIFRPNFQAPFGGAEIQIATLAQELARDSRFEIHVVVGNYGQPRHEFIGRLAIHNGIPYRIPKTTTLQLLGTIASINADIIVQRAAGEITGLCSLLSKMRRRRFVYMTAHEIDCNGGFERQQPRIFGALYRYGIRHADLVITQSNEQAQLVQDFHGRPSTVLRTSYAIPDESELRAETKKAILWVGRCEPWKQPEIFLNLARRFPKESFVMIAPFALDRMNFERIKTEAQSLPNCTFIPFVPFSSINTYFRDAKIYINTSRFEGFPNTFIQAAMHKTPILSLVVNPDNVLETNEMGLWANGDTNKLSDLLQNMLNHPELLRKLGGNGYRYTMQSHDVRTNARQFGELLLTLAKIPKS